MPRRRYTRGWWASLIAITAAFAAAEAAGSTNALAVPATGATATASAESNGADGDVAAAATDPKVGGVRWGGRRGDGGVAVVAAAVEEGGGGGVSGSGQAVSLFGPEEKELDRYAAALAATHFLRQERDKIIKLTTNPLAHLYLSVTKPDQHNRWMTSPWVSDKARQAQKSYLVQAGNIIRSNGLTTGRYNDLSHILGKRKDLRDRVQHQAYLYRVNADLRGDKIHPLVDLPEATTPRGNRRGEGDRKVKKEERQKKSSTPDRNMLFAKTLREIETVRIRQRRRLMNELGCDELPPGLCRPSMGRIAPRFRKACERFPVVAEGIVKSNGLKVEEFNRLSARCRSNAFYRWQILQRVRKLNRRVAED